MRIVRISVDGWGPLHDLVIEPSPGLTVVHGQNEAGKSSLLAFIRAILFGFPTGAYPALAGGARGGALTVVTGSGQEFRIERHGETGGAGKLSVRGPDGSEMGPEALRRLLEGVEARTYTSLFAFGLGELAELATLGSADVASRIAGAGQGTGAVAPIDVERALEAGATELFRPNGSVQPIAKLLVEREALQGRLAGLDVPAHYHELRAERQRLEERLAALDGRAEELRRRAALAERLVAAWPGWLELRDAEARLASMAAPELPEETAVRLAELETSVATARVALAGVDARLRQLMAERALVDVDEPLVARRAAVAEVLRALDRDRTLERERADAHATLARARDSLEEDLARLGSGWDAERVAAFDETVALRAEIAGPLRSALELARSEHAARTRDLDAAEQALAQAREDAGSIESRIRELAAAAAAAAVGSVGAPQDPALIADREQQLAELDRLVVRREALASVPTNLVPQVPVPPRLAPSRVMLALAVAVALAGIVGTGAAIALRVQPLAAAVSTGAGLIVAAIIVLLARATARRTVRAQVGAEEAELAAKHQAFLAQLAELDGQVAAIARSLGLVIEIGATAPAKPAVEALRGSLAAARDALARRAGLDQQLESAHDRTTRSELRRDEQAAAVIGAADAMAGAADAWSKRLVEAGLDPDLTPEAALATCDVLRGAKAQQRELSAAGQRVESLDETHRSFVTLAATLLQQLGRPVDLEDAIPGALSRLGDDLEAALAKSTERARHDDEMLRLGEERRGRYRDLEDRERALRELLSNVGAPDADALRASLATADRRRTLEAERATLEAGLAARSGPGAALAAFRAELERIADITEAASESTSVERDLAAIDAEREDLVGRIRSVGDRASELERSAEATLVRQGLADADGRLLALADRWAVQAAALALLRRTRERYEREHRPAVVRRAEELICRWTDGRYCRIVAPLGGRIEGLERADGRVVPIGALSTGTEQQLYLALRVALVDHRLTSGAESLPLVMDDILVNFDDARAGRTARSIEELASRHQVLYFTCHPSTPLRGDRELELVVRQVRTAEPEGGTRPWR